MMIVTMRMRVRIIPERSSDITLGLSPRPGVLMFATEKARGGSSEFDAKGEHLLHLILGDKLYLSNLHYNVLE